MTETESGEKSEGSDEDYSESPAFTMDEEGNPHLNMETLSKGGDEPDDTRNLNEEIE